MVDSIKLNILYEDNHIIVLEKPINVPTCLDESKDMDLLSMVKLYLKEKYNKPGNVYAGLVHRLDRPVGGVMVFAKTSKAAKRLSEEVRNKTFKKEYYAVIDGVIKEDGHFEDYLEKDAKKNVVHVSPSGKYASLSYSVLDIKEDKTLVKVSLETGRSHQIRVQFSSRNYPLFGDQKYNKKASSNEQIALYSSSISFKHPVTKEVLTFTLELPDRYPFNLFKNK